MKNNLKILTNDKVALASFILASFHPSQFEDNFNFSGKMPLSIQLQLSQPPEDLVKKML